MNTMTRALALALAATTLVSLAACNRRDNPNAASSAGLSSGSDSGAASAPYGTASGASAPMDAASR
jgi:hypothetical protein